MPDEPEVQIQIRRMLVAGASTPSKVVHKFYWTRVGTDISVDIGYYDLVELRDAIGALREDPAGGQVVNLYVTDRLLLSPSGAQSFIESAEQLKNDLRAAGIDLTQEQGGKKEDGDA